MKRNGEEKRGRGRRKRNSKWGEIRGTGNGNRKKKRKEEEEDERRERKGERRNREEIDRVNGIIYWTKPMSSYLAPLPLSRHTRIKRLYQLHRGKNY